MKKVTEVVYIANDGQRFTTEEDCKKHEGLLTPEGFGMVLDYAETISPSAVRRFSTALIMEFKRLHNLPALKNLSGELCDRRSKVTGELFNAYDDKIYSCNIVIREIERYVA